MDLMEQTNPLAGPPANFPSSKKTILIVLSATSFIALSSLATYLLAKSQTPSQISVNSPTPLVRPTSTPDPTANWKTYSDKVMAISFKYPNAWDVSAQAPGSDYYILIKNFVPKSATAPPERGELLIRITSGLRKADARWEWIKGIDTLQKLIDILPSNKDVIEQKTLKIGNNDALTRTVTTYQTNCGNTVWEEIFILDGKGKVIIISYDGDIASFRNIFDQILSTFKFD